VSRNFQSFIKSPKKLRKDPFRVSIDDSQGIHVTSLPFIASLESILSISSQASHASGIFWCENTEGGVAPPVWCSFLVTCNRNKANEGFRFGFLLFLFLFVQPLSL
jgi:hypothetical protein